MKRSNKHLKQIIETVAKNGAVKSTVNYTVFAVAELRDTVYNDRADPTMSDIERVPIEDVGLLNVAAEIQRDRDEISLKYKILKAEIEHIIHAYKYGTRTDLVLAMDRYIVKHGAGIRGEW